MPFDIHQLNDAAAQVALIIPIGSGWSRYFQIIEKRSGTPQNLSSSTFKGELRNSAGDLIASFTFDVSDDFLSFTVSLTSEEIETIGLTTLVFDWFRTVGSQSVKILNGTLTVVSSVTEL